MGCGPSTGPSDAAPHAGQRTTVALGLPSNLTDFPPTKNAIRDTSSLLGCPQVLQDDLTTVRSAATACAVWGIVLVIVTRSRCLRKDFMIARRADSPTVLPRARSGVWLTC